MPHILIVCTANICRSPVGEALLRDRLAKKGLDNWSVSSAGTWAKIERGAARYSIQLMGKQGHDLTNHRARMIKRTDLKEADLILCMELGHVEALRAEFPAYARKVHLFNDLIGKNYNIHDPYGQSKDAYQTMIAEITEVIESGLDRIIELADNNHRGRGK